MKLFEKIISYLQGLTKKESERLLVIVLATTALVMGGIIYFIYQTSDSLVASIKRLEKLANKATIVLHDYEKIQSEENRVISMLERQKDFNIKIYFEQFCKEQNITPATEWDTYTESINPKFDEIRLSASFKDQTTQKLVKILEELDKREIIYIKNLSMKTEKEKQRIAFDITIATKKSKG